MKPSAAIKRARQVVAECIWSVAHWLYPYVDHEYDDSKHCYWTMDATFVGTEREADEWFERLCEVACEGHHPMTPCPFAVGGMQRHSLDEDENVTAERGEARS